jgi:hypothetical protein
MANIYITLIDSFYNIQSVGSIALVDDIYFDQANDINDQDNFPVEYSLWQNFPNPFNPSTKIKYSVPQFSNVELKLFDVLGNEIETLVDEEKTAGTYEVTWYAVQLPSGVYFYQLKASGYLETKKMILLR